MLRISCAVISMGFITPFFPFDHASRNTTKKQQQQQKKTPKRTRNKRRKQKDVIRCAFIFARNIFKFVSLIVEKSSERPHVRSKHTHKQQQHTWENEDYLERQIKNQRKKAKRKKRTEKIEMDSRRKMREEMAK